ncbi:uncharacterized protein K460DRAFT_421104 [Cucurbitaria berberidis CBS 394.84]|uniref:Uncharacterized protein n=1 Tax=Cucurbitaria berberidis CBS 394.84 TaxID=1168544 RepID=A0A9P4L3B2_9PLEO|nr:uncharacterized protein K460DRAFT_421104 [Cucurbitaria berberidis CBS 394.84]KAF1840094.1 hypothetical protein K460DRAFT_421104 [Cucurbitaria berberidis CBS 394.84]
MGGLWELVGVKVVPLLSDRSTSRRSRMHIHQRGVISVVLKGSVSQHAEPGTVIACSDSPRSGWDLLRTYKLSGWTQAVDQWSPLNIGNTASMKSSEVDKVFLLRLSGIVPRNLPPSSCCLAPSPTSPKNTFAASTLHKSLHPMPAHQEMLASSSTLTLDTFLTRRSRTIYHISQALPRNCFQPQLFKIDNFRGHRRV